MKNAIEKYTPKHEIIDGAAQEDDEKPQEKFHFKSKLPQPWFEFKNLIYEVYDHRIQHAPEINGSINTNYMGMEEHMICFFIDKYKKRKEIECQIIEFMASLKYYAEIWPRAKLYAQIVGFYQVDDSYFNKRHSGTTENRFPPRLNEGRIDETEYTPFNDIFTQEFFLHCYSITSKERAMYVESKEGHTYLRHQLEDKCSQKLLTFI